MTTYSDWHSAVVSRFDAQIMVNVAHIGIMLARFPTAFVKGTGSPYKLSAQVV
jgi:hypothetical protein